MGRGSSEEEGKQGRKKGRIEDKRKAPTAAVRNNITNKRNGCA